MSALVVPTTRLEANTTHFGWDNFEDPAPSTFLSDTTPDIGDTTAVGVKFETTNGQLHRAASTGNFYSGHSGTAAVAEEVTVVTSGTVGAEGQTTIIAQLVGSGAFPGLWTFGDINDVEPVVVQGKNAAGLGQVWVKWVVPGNAASYTFTIGAIPGQHMSFDKIVVDTYWGAEAQVDTMVATTPPLASILDQEEEIVPPSTRGNLNTTHFGWDNFEDPAPGTFLEDTTPDLGDTSLVGVKFETTNGQLHRAASSGNYYSGHSGTAAVAETVTVVTSGIVGSTGYTTIIAQLIAGSGNFTSDWTFGKINDVDPVVVHGMNAADKGQVWVKWVVPGNAATYEFTIGSVPHIMFGGAHMSFDKIEIDTLWSATAQADTMKAKTVEITTEALADATKGTSYSAQLEAEGGESPHTWTLKGETLLPEGLTLSEGGLISGTPTALGLSEFTVVAESADGYEAETDLAIDVLPGRIYHFTLKGETDLVVPSTRGAVNSTYFGWDNFEDPAPGTFLSDTTPDLGDTEIVGVKFETTNGQLHRASSSGNFYSGHSGTAEVAEKVTVVTQGTVGEEGQTTILVQMIGSGAFPSGAVWTFGDINDVSPEVIQGTNAANLGQVWVKWVVPGHAASYEFTIGSVPGQHMSFNKIVIDTFWSDEEQPGDTMILEEPAAIAYIMDQATAIVAPSSRGTPNTTYFGWDGFGVTGVTAVIDDSTPDIGTYTGELARFRTTNEQIHQFVGGGNLYFLSGTLAEEITVPTEGVVGESGFTTVFLQIASASSGMGGGSFSDVITTTLDGSAPTLVVQGSGANTALFWAKWEIPGNKATYTIQIDGPPGVPHFSFDKVIVDTKFSAYGYVADSMRPQTVEITTETLADATKDVPYSVQLEAEGGVSPYTWTLKPAVTAGVGGAPDVDIPLPEGLSLSASGVLTWTPGVLGDFSFTAVAESTDGYDDEITYELSVVSGLNIVTTSLPTPVVGKEYGATLIATGGPAPLVWTVAEGTALPAGLSLSSSGVISGIPTVAGDGNVTFTVTDADTSEVSKELALNVSASLLPPAVDAITFDAKFVGEDFSYQVTAANYPTKFTISGLPAGVKYVPATGLISGRVNAAGVYLVQIRASNAGGSSAAVSAPLVVKVLPAAQVGNFTGLIARDSAANTGLGSQFNLTTTASGAYTLKVKTGSATKSAKGFLNGSAPQVKINVDGSDLALTLDAETGLVSGTHGAAAVSGWLTVWDKKFNPPSSREGFYSVALDLADEDDLEDATIPHGIGYATFSILPAGTLKVVGRTADGQVITSATTLGPNGEVAVYASLYAKKGTLLGSLGVSEDEDGLFLNNKVTGSLSWQKPETKGRLYSAVFGPVDLSVEGGYLGTATKRPVVLGLPETGGIEISFDGADVEASETNPNVTGAVWTEAYKADLSAAVNAGKLVLKVNKATGAVTGSFALTETETPLVRKGVKILGQVVRLSDAEVKVVGYFLLPQIPVDGQKANAAPIRSGAFFISQPVLP